MNISTYRPIAFSLGLCLVLEVAAGHGAPEKIPRDKVIHPIMGSVSQAEVLPETRKAPAYPEKWRKRHLGAQVILQVVVDKLGKVTDVNLLKTNLRLERECGKGAADTTGGETKGRNGPKKASRDFEAAAISAVKKWRFRPGMQSGVPVDVYQTLIIEFTPCPTSADA